MFDIPDSGLIDFPLPGDEALRALGLAGPQARPPASAARFPDGGAVRFEIPSVEGPAPLAAVIEEARRLGVALHRVSQGSGVMMLTDGEISEMLSMCEETALELCLFLGPRASWDIGGGRASTAGAGGARARGRDQLGQALADAERAAGLGVRCLLTADEGVLWALHELRAAGALPEELTLKMSALSGPLNPAAFALQERIGADSINVPSDLTIAQLAELRSGGAAAIDVYVEAPDDLGGFVRLYDSAELVRVAAPVYLKYGLRNAPGIYPVGRHLADLAVATARERVRRAHLGQELLARSGAALPVSPAGARRPPEGVRRADMGGLGTNGAVREPSAVSGRTRISR